MIADVEDVWFLRRDEIKQALWDVVTAWATGVTPRGTKTWPKEIVWRKGVMQKFKEVTAGASKLTRRHIIVLAHFFGVSREAMVRRLEELGLTKGGTWDWFANNGGITDEQARQVLGDLVPQDAQKGEANRPTTLRLNLLAAEVHRRGLLSEGQLARLLHLTRVELRQILEEVEPDETDSDGVVALD